MLIQISLSASVVKLSELPFKDFLRQIGISDTYLPLFKTHSFEDGLPYKKQIDKITSVRLKSEIRKKLGSPEEEIEKHPDARQIEEYNAEDPNKPVDDQRPTFLYKSYVWELPGLGMVAIDVVPSKVKPINKTLKYLFAITPYKTDIPKKVKAVKVHPAHVPPKRWIEETEKEKRLNKRK